MHAVTYIIAQNITHKYTTVIATARASKNSETGKGKGHSATGHEGPGWSRGIALLFL
jgi:hypothetical protein